MTSLRNLVLALCVGSSGCIVTPVPDPPDLTGPRMEGVALDPSLGIVTAATEVRGSPGTALPGATLVIVPLSSSLPAAATIVAEDGSFRTLVVAASGEELRLSLRAGLARAAPVDVVVPESVGPAMRAPRDPCIVVEPELDFGEIDVGDEVMDEITIRNECSGLIRLGAMLRAPSAVLFVDPPTDTSLEVGASTVVPVRFAPTAPGSYEQVVLLPIAGAVTERRPVTIFGSAL